MPSVQAFSQLIFISILKENFARYSRSGQQFTFFLAFRISAEIDVTLMTLSSPVISRSPVAAFHTASLLQYP